MIVDSNPYFFAIVQMGGDRARASTHTTRSVLKKVYYYQQRWAGDETKVSALCRVDCIEEPLQKTQHKAETCGGFSPWAPLRWY